MKYTILLLLLLPFVSSAQTAKRDTVARRDTIEGVVVYTGHSNLRYIAKGNYHTYTCRATQIRTDTGIISIHTDLGYIDLKKNYQFIPLNNLQPAKLNRKP